MMYISRENKLYKRIILFILLFICAACAMKDPSKQSNDVFLSRHGKDVRTAKNRHKRIIARNKQVSLAESRAKQEKIKEEKSKKELIDEYAIYRGSYFNDYYKDRPDYQEEPRTELSYLSKNVNAYEVSQINFDNIQIPRKDAFFSDELGHKDFAFVNNFNMQKSYDHLYSLQKKRDKNLRESQARQRRIKEEQEATVSKDDEQRSILDRTRKTVRGFRDRVLDLLNK
jgi:hypothetical protein